MTVAGPTKAQIKPLSNESQHLKTSVAKMTQKNGNVKGIRF
jgi:hypothetical protein